MTDVNSPSSEMVENGGSSTPRLAVQFIQPPQELQNKTYHDFATDADFTARPVRKATLDALRLYNFKNDAGETIEWSWGQIEIIDCILHRSSPNDLKRIQIIASTQYGKSIAVAAGVVIRASTIPEKWAIVAGTDEKAKIIMEYVIMLSTNNPIVITQLVPETTIEQLRMKRSADRLVYKSLGEVRVYSANATRVRETSTSLMGFGSPNVIEDESALVPDTLQATVMRMLGGTKDNFLVKIGNPFNRNHFLKTWISGRYYQVFIDFRRALDENRYTESFIDEMKDEALFEILYGCMFPSGEGMDLKGWLPLLTEAEVERAMVDEEYMFGERRLGVDVSGGGRNYSTLVLRSHNYARKVYKKNEPDTMRFAANVIHYALSLTVSFLNVFIDKVGVGKGVYDRVHEQRNQVVGVNAGTEPMDELRFINLRAEIYWRTREWILSGGKLERDDDWYQLTRIKYKIVDRTGKIQIMSKEEMLKNGIDSPDVADGLSLTFVRPESATVVAQQQAQQHETVTVDNLDPYARR